MFGPVISAVPFDSLEEVIAVANDTPYGLGSGVWTSSLATAHRMAAALHAGSVWINSYQLMDPAVPFGGFKMSGFGKESGSGHIDQFLNVKAIIVRLE